MQPTLRRRSKSTFRHALRAFATSIILTGPAFAGLELGSSGAAVLNVQKTLTKTGHYSGKLDGKFGPAMKAAVIKFQQQNGIDADGVVGTATYDKLLPVAAAKEPKLKTGSKDAEAVTRLQNLLNGKGASVKVDGKFGKGTVDAVKAFQKKEGLTPVDGIVGAKTWDKLKA